MTVATYTTNLTEIIGDTQTNSTTGWTALGGGASGLNAGETDYFIEQGQCITKNAFASVTRGMIYNTGSDQGGSGTDGAYSMWCTHTAPNSLATKASGGMQFLIGSATNAYEQYYVGGSDTMTFLGWQFVAVNEATAGDATTGSPSATSESTFGALWNLPSGGPTKGAPNAIDCVRVGRHDIVIEFGTGADPEATFSGILSNLETATNRWGMLAQRTPGGAFENSGLIQFGTSTNAVEFNDSNKVIFLRDHDHVTSGFNAWESNNASSVITFSNLVVKALGTTSPGSWTTNDNSTLNWSTCNFIEMGTFSFDTNSTIDTCTFLSCGQITHAGADMTGSSVLTSSVAADEGAVLYDINADPDGEMDGMTFTKGTNDHHAIRFGTNVPATMTLRNCTFNGFSSSDDVNGSVFRFDDTSGNITLNLVGCTTDGAFSVDDAAGVTVTINIDPVTTLVNIKDPDGNNEPGVSVYLEAADGTGDLPYQESVTISRASGGLATVSHTGHGLNTNEYIKFIGIVNAEEDNSGAFQITKIDNDSYSYTSNGTTALSYTGTITATGATIYGTTDDPDGNISSSRTYTNNQPLKGYARKATTAPYYKTIDINDTVNNTTGLTISRRLILDQ